MSTTAEIKAHLWGGLDIASVRN